MNHSRPKSDVNILRMFCKESRKHFMTKAALFHLLISMGHDVITEFQLPNGYGDLLDLTVNVHYELEFNMRLNKNNKKLELYKRPGVEIIVINCDKLSKDYNDMAELLKEYIVPD